MTQEALRMALDALEANDQLINGTGTNGGLLYCIDGYYSDCFDVDPINKQTEEAITAIKEALVQPEQEPVAWMDADGNTFPFVWNVGVQQGSKYLDETLTPLYTHPPQRTWVGLTDEEIEEGIKQSWVTEQAFQSAAWWAEAKLKEKNNA